MSRDFRHDTEIEPNMRPPAEAGGLVEHMPIDRFDLDEGGFLGDKGRMEPDATGEWVRYSDALNAISAQKSIIAMHEADGTAARKAASDNFSALASERAAHAETKRMWEQACAMGAMQKARLAEAMNALEPFADIADLIDSETEGMSETDELALHFHDYLMASWPVALFRTARRVREGGKADG